MKLIPHTNNKPHPVTVGNKTIAPGQTRPVDASLLGKRETPPRAAMQMVEPAISLLDQLEGQSIDERRQTLAALSPQQLEDLAEEMDDDHPVMEQLREAQLAHELNPGAPAGDAGQNPGAPAGDEGQNPVASEKVTAILAKPLAQATPELEALEDGELEEAATAEVSGQNRKGLLDAIGSIQTKRLG